MNWKHRGIVERKQYLNPYLAHHSLVVADISATPKVCASVSSTLPHGLTLRGVIHRVRRDNTVSSSHVCAHLLYWTLYNENYVIGYFIAKGIFIV